ncbi:MAG: RHS repeat-associated core domain-containing protein [Nitrospira sp.]|nr:RHS repeat-associated core domain-containing protein [Nitrospira sp.]
MNASRAIATVGTNGGSAWTRPGSVPSGSDTVLVTSQTYNDAGWTFTTTDPRGIVSHTYYDALARVTKTIQAYVNGTVSAQDDKITEFTYDGSNHLTGYKAWLNSTTAEITEYDYGVAAYVDGCYVSSNDLLWKVYYPDIWSPGSRPPQFHNAYDAAARKVRMTDANGTVHEYGFDRTGRPTTDAVTTLASGVDGSVRRLETAYDSAGRPYLFTSYTTATGSTVYNQVQRTFNGYGQVLREYQNTVTSVSLSTTLYVAYGYATSGNTSRPTSMTYPGTDAIPGKQLAMVYNAGVDATISRLSQINYDGSSLEEYQYLGLGTTVRRTQTAAGLRQTFWETGATSDSGDVYNGFDRFGRVVNLLWETTGGTDRALFKYGYDRDGNRLYRTNELNHNFDELYHVSGKTTDTDRYDRLNQLTGFARGTLSDSNSDGVLDTVSTAGRTQSWTFDGVGNFPTVATNSATQTRTHNIQNQLLTLVDGSTTTTLDYDDNGNMIVGENGVELGYDAWNRLTRYGSTTYFRYDVTGRRSLVIYSNPSTGTHYRNLYYDTGWQLLEERGTTTDATRNQYVWTPAYIDGLVVRLTDSAGDGTYETRHYALTDANWNITAITSDTGTVLERFVSDPYGRFDVFDATWTTLQTAGSAYAWDYFHQGGRYDYATGLFHYRHRDYSPTLMRWVGMDPIGLRGGDTNLYQYISATPVSHVDPWGLEKDFMRGRDYERECRPGSNDCCGLSNGGNLKPSLGAPVPTEVHKGMIALYWETGRWTESYGFPLWHPVLCIKIGDEVHSVSYAGNWEWDQGADRQICKKEAGNRTVESSGVHQLNYYELLTSLHHKESDDCGRYNFFHHNCQHAMSNLIKQLNARSSNRQMTWHDR